MSKNTVIIFKVFFIIVSFLYIIYCVLYEEGRMFLDAMNLCIHELGHFLFAPFGEFLHVLGGSLFQLGLPLALVLYSIYKKQRYSASVLLLWVGQNMFNISTYIKDARAQVLTLFPRGALHDWNLLLGWMGLLNKDILIGNTVYALGFIVVILAFLSGVFFALKNER